LSFCIETSHPVSGNRHSEIEPRTTRRMVGIVNGGVFLVVAGLVLVVYLTPLKDWLADGQIIKDQLALFGLAAPVAFTVATALLTVIGTPRLLLCTLGGMAFGFTWGLIWSQLGTLIGSYVIFLFFRWRGRDYALRHFSRFRGFSKLMENQGVLSVVVLRQLPLNGFYNNVLLGLAPVSHGGFIFGSLLGFLPLGITACLLGAGLIQRDLFTGMQYVAFGLAGSTILGFIVNCLINKSSTTGNYESH